MRIQRVLANNPGPYTGPGTNTWVLDDGFGSVVIIDPGPVDSRHVRAIAEVVDQLRVEAVLVTHTHVDHAPLANPLAKEFGVPAVGYAAGPQFTPDIRLLDGARFDFGRMNLEVIHTPGHADDHLCFRAGEALFTGDHIKGGSSVMVESMGQYLDSLRKLRGRGFRRFHPGHGDEIEHPDDVIDWYIAHRLQRHEEIYRAIAAGSATVDEIVQSVYTDVDPELHPLAARSVEAHVTLLADQGRIALEGGLPVVSPPS